MILFNLKKRSTFNSDNADISIVSNNNILFIYMKIIILKNV